MKDFTNILRTHNLKATPQRLAILEIIFFHRHINIDKLYDEVKQKFDSISLATIYKNINAMTKNMLLQEIKLPNEKNVYEMIKEEHSHLLCNKCGKVIDIQVETKDITKDIEKKYDFTISQSDVVLSGTCKNCH